MSSQLPAKIQIQFLKEGKQFIAYSPALDLSAAGESFEEAKKNFSEVLEIFLEEVGEDIVEVLIQLGWEKQSDRLTPPVIIAHELMDFSVNA